MDTKGAADKRSMNRRIGTGKLLLFAAVLLVVAGGLGWWKRRGIRNTFLRMAGIEVPRNITKKMGYYGQALPITFDFSNTVHVTGNDDADLQMESNVPAMSSVAQTTRLIEDALTEELESGAYTFDDPLVIQDPFQNSPLTALVLFETDETHSVRCTVQGKTKEADLALTMPAQTMQKVPVIGLYPETDNNVRLELLGESGEVLRSREIIITTSGLPENMDGMVEPVTMNGSSAWPLTMVYGQKCLHPFAYDCNGDIRWYLSEESGFYGCYPLSNGRFILQTPLAYSPSCGKPQTAYVQEMDYLGRTWKTYCLPFGFHHEVKEKEPDGNLLCLSSSMEGHYEDVIIELDREDGQIVNRLKLSDLFANTYTQKMDWAHLNTVSYQPDDDTILISARNVHSVMKIGWTDHKLKWILCDPAFWKGTKFEKYVLTPENGEEILWHYQQHTAYEIEEDLDGDPDTIQVSLFDNHIDSHRPVQSFSDTGSSYVTVYAVNEQKGTVSVLRQFEILQSDICSLTLYDSETGHLFGMSGIIGEEAWGGFRGMNYEFDYETGDLVNQFAIRDQFYRATQMKLAGSSMYVEGALPENDLAGTLFRPMETDKALPQEKGLLKEGVTLSRLGSTLLVRSRYHYVSQVIFLGEKNTYVYDITSVILERKQYTNFTAGMPVSLSGLKPDRYRVLGVYMDELYGFTVNGEEAFIEIKEA